MANASLKDRVAIITGSSRGLGRVMALRFAQEGAAVVVAARSEEEKGALPGTIYATAREIEEAGGRALPVPCDVSREESIQGMVQRVISEYGRVDTLVNNAGVAFYAGVQDMPVKRWDLVMAVNLRGTFLCCKYVLPHMVERRNGSIINISSRAADARQTTFTGIAYGVSKAAIERFTWQLAAEVSKHNIAVNCLKPRGPVDTDGMRFQNPNADWSKWDSPDRMARAALYLASQDAQGVTATVATDEEVLAWHGLE